MTHSLRFAAALACAALLSGCAGQTSSPTGAGATNPASRPASSSGGSTALTIPTVAPNGRAEEIPATLTKPDGTGPFPAIVILHDCSGLNPGSSGAPARWTRELVPRGYVVITPDSFTTRGFRGGICTDPSPRRADVVPGRRQLDAYAALAYLRTLAYVDGRHVGVMGGSHGGASTLATMFAAADDSEALAQQKRAGFAGAVALYPACTGRQTTWMGAPVYKAVAPLRILIGNADDWTPAEPCRHLVETAAAAGYPVSIKIYPGAHHSFDSDRPVRYVATRINGNSPTGRGATTGGDPRAWQDAIREVVAFFGTHLK